MTRPEFPSVWDATMVRDFRDCPQKFYLTHIRHLHSPEDNIHLHFGGCFAVGLREMRRTYYGIPTGRIPGGDTMTALAAGAKAIIKAWGEAMPPEGGTGAVKSLEACLDALLSFALQYPMDREAVVPLMHDGEPIVEQTFAAPFPWVRHPVTQQPIIYAGRFDMLCQYRGSETVLIDDEKTTTRLGESWGKQWRMRSQLTGYFWGVEQFGYKASGVIVRGIGILKKDITHAFVVEQRAPFMVERWLEQTQRDIARAIDMWGQGYWDWNLDDACGNFGGCQFLDACTSNDPDKWLSRFVERKWDPLARQVA